MLSAPGLKEGYLHPGRIVKQPEKGWSVTSSLVHMVVVAPDAEQGELAEVTLLQVIVRNVMSCYCQKNSNGRRQLVCQ